MWKRKQHKRNEAKKYRRSLFLFLRVFAVLWTLRHAITFPHFFIFTIDSSLTPRNVVLTHNLDLWCFFCYLFYLWARILWECVPFVYLAYVSDANRHKHIRKAKNPFKIDAGDSDTAHILSIYVFILRNSKKKKTKLYLLFIHTKKVKQRWTKASHGRHTHTGFSERTMATYDNQEPKGPSRQLLPHMFTYKQIIMHELYTAYDYVKCDFPFILHGHTGTK